MFKKLMSLLLVAFIVVQALSPSVAFADESEYEASYEIAESDLAEDALELEHALDEEAVATESAELIEASEVGTSEALETVADDFEPWTESQLIEWQELINENWAKQDHISSLLFFAEGVFDIADFETELLALSNELWVLMDAVAGSYLSFADAIVALTNNTTALENLAARIEALGVVALPPFSNWMPEQIEEWEVLQFENWGITARIRGLEMNTIEDNYFTFEQFREKFGDFLVEFMALEVESAQIRNDAYRSRLSFEEAVALLEANTRAFADLFERLEIAISEAIHGQQIDPTPPVDDANEIENDDDTGGGNNEDERITLPQTGATLINTVFVGSGFVAAGAMMSVMKNKRKNN